MPGALRLLPAGPHLLDPQLRDHSQLRLLSPLHRLLRNLPRVVIGLRASVRRRPRLHSPVA